MTNERVDSAPPISDLERLTVKHLSRYAAMLEAHGRSEPGFRARELRDLLGTWQSVKACGYDWNLMSKEARMEVYDALESGE